MKPIIKVAPFFDTDVLYTPGFQLWRMVGTSLVADGSFNTTSLYSIPNQTNGYAVKLDETLLTLASDGGYRGVIAWSSGGNAGQVFYVADEIYVPPSKSLLDMTQTYSSSNTANTVGDAFNAMRAQGFGKWVKSGTTLTLYGADGTTVVRTFTLNDATNPTQRA